MKTLLAGAVVVFTVFCCDCTKPQICLQCTAPIVRVYDIKNADTIINDYSMQWASQYSVVEGDVYIARGKYYDSIPGDTVLIDTLSNPMITYNLCYDVDLYNNYYYPGNKAFYSTYCKGI
jgi:hypothetical protein